MKTRISPTAFACAMLVALTSCTGFKQDLQIKTSGDSLEYKVDSIVLAKMNGYNIPGLSIGLIRNDSILYTKGYGVTDIETSEPVTANSVFHTASVSKLFTAQAIMMLISQEKLSLDDKLVHILPELNYKDKAIETISISQLLNHTSGLPDISNYHWENNNQSATSLKDYVLDLDLELEHQPNTTYHYSNLGYDVLGYVIEKKSNQPFEDFIRDNIFMPSKMNSSDFRYFEIDQALRVSPHSRNFITKNPYVRGIYPYTREHAPSSTLNASAKDLSQWMISFLKEVNGSDSKSVFTKMLQPSVDNYPYIGLGFQLNVLHSKKTIGHYGGDKGFRSYLLMFPEEKTGLVLLANCDYEEDFRQEILHPISKLLLDATP